MLDLLQAVFLAVMPCITEFLPNSSTGHLVLTPWWPGWNMPPVVFPIAVYLGTLAAVFLYFRRDRLTMERAAIIAPQHRKTEDPDSHLLFWVEILPAALAGLLSDCYHAGRRSLDSRNAIDAHSAGVGWELPRSNAACYRRLLAPPAMLGAGIRDVLLGSRTAEQHNRTLPPIHGVLASRQRGLIGFERHGARCGVHGRLAALFS